MGELREGTIDEFDLPIYAAILLDDIARVRIRSWIEIRFDKLGFPFREYMYRIGPYPETHYTA
jgi:hypothetical protein